MKKSNETAMLLALKKLKPQELLCAILSAYRGLHMEEIRGWEGRVVLIICITGFTRGIIRSIMDQLTDNLVDGYHKGDDDIRRKLEVSLYILFKFIREDYLKRIANGEIKEEDIDPSYLDRELLAIYWSLQVWAIDMVLGLQNKCSRLEGVKKEMLDNALKNVFSAKVRGGKTSIGAKRLKAIYEAGQVPTLELISLDNSHTAIVGVMKDDTGEEIIWESRTKSDRLAMTEKNGGGVSKSQKAICTADEATLKDVKTRITALKDKGDKATKEEKDELCGLEKYYYDNSWNGKPRGDREADQQASNGYTSVRTSIKRFCSDQWSAKLIEYCLETGYSKCGWKDPQSPIVSKKLAKKLCEIT